MRARQGRIEQIRTDQVRTRRGREGERSRGQNGGERRTGPMQGTRRAIQGKIVQKTAQRRARQGFAWLNCTVLD